MLNEIDKKAFYQKNALCKHVVVAVCLMFAVAFKANAQQGCLLNGSVYATYNKYIFLFFDLSYYSNPISTSCPNPSTPANSFAFTSNPSGSCAAGFSPFTAATGQLVNYQIRQCSLDDCLPLLFAGIAFLGASTMKRRHYHQTKFQLEACDNKENH